MKTRVPNFIYQLWPKLLFIPPVIAGVVVLAMLVRNRMDPERQPESEVPRVLRVIRAPLQEILPCAMGYGTAEPGDVWQAIAEVRGRVIQVDEDLNAGAIIKSGTEVLVIDPAEYELAIAQLDATINQTVAQLDELTVKQANDEASLAIEIDSLNLAENELRRLTGLYENKAISDSELDQQQRNVLLQRQKVQSLNNALKLFPSQKKSIEANLAVQRASLRRPIWICRKPEFARPLTVGLGRSLSKSVSFWLPDRTCSKLKMSTQLKSKPRSPRNTSVDYCNSRATVIRWS